MTCIFFGHRDTPMGIRETLKSRIVEQIIAGADNFLVGTEGGFDSMVYSVLCELRADHPQIAVSRVLAYLPTKKEEYSDTSDTVYPEGLESVPRRFAISKRNEWMVKQSDTVICYIERPQGGAAKFVEYARKKGKHIINIANLTDEIN